MVGSALLTRQDDRIDAMLPDDSIVRPSSRISALLQTGSFTDLTLVGSFGASMTPTCGGATALDVGLGSGST